MHVISQCIMHYVHLVLMYMCICMNLVVTIMRNVCMQVLHSHANLVHVSRRDLLHMCLHNPRRD